MQKMHKVNQFLRVRSANEHNLKNFKDQVKSNKENDEEIEVIAETKTNPKKKTVKKTAKKKQAVKKKT